MYFSSFSIRLSSSNASPMDRLVCVSFQEWKASNSWPLTTAATRRSRLYTSWGSRDARRTRSENFCFASLTFHRMDRLDL